MRVSLETIQVEKKNDDVGRTRDGGRRDARAATFFARARARAIARSKPRARRTDGIESITPTRTLRRRRLI